MLTEFNTNIINPYTKISYCVSVPLFPITLLVGQYKTSIINAIQNKYSGAVLKFDNSILNSNSNRPNEIKRLIECLHKNDILLVDDIDLFYDIDSNAIDIFENIPNGLQIICSAHNKDFILYFLDIMTEYYSKVDTLKSSTAGQYYGITRIRQYNDKLRTAIYTQSSLSIEHLAIGFSAESYLRGDQDNETN